MAVEPISALTALGAAPATGDLLVLVDISDTTQAPTGTTKRMTVANLFTAPTFTGLTSATGGLLVSGGSGAAGRIYATAADGTVIFASNGATTDFLLTNHNGGSALSISNGGVLLTFYSSTLLATAVSLTNGAAGNTATLTNAPAVGNPTKWIPISDNGTTRYIPCW